MSKLSFVLSILVLPFAFHSIQAQEKPQPAETRAGTATISGRVMLKGEPARGAMVILRARGQDALNSPRARTDESGRFHFGSLPAGSYSVFAVAPGYVSHGDANLSLSGRPGKTINLADGEKVENVDLEIKRGGVIAGRVIDAQGRPVIEMGVNLSRLDENNQPRGFSGYDDNYDMRHTDDRGFYRIYGLPEGRYLVSVGDAEGTGSLMSRREFYPLVFYPNAVSAAEAKEIKVSEASEVVNIDITVSDPKQTFDVYGRVVDADSGQPVAGVEVVIGSVTKAGGDISGYGVSGERSVANGAFRIFGVVPGRYAVFARPDGLKGGLISAPVIVDISEDTSAEVRVRQGSSISGVVVIEGTNDPKVHAKLSQIGLAASTRPTGQGPLVPGVSSARANADGGFRLSGLQPGRVTISTVLSSDTRDLMMSRIERNGAPVDGGIEVEAGEEVSGVRVILLHAPFTIRGELKVIGGALPAGCRFIAAPRRVDQPGQRVLAAEIDARRQFVIENLPAGEYEIRVLLVHPMGSQPLIPEIGRLISPVKEAIVLHRGNPPPIVFTLDLSRKEGDQ